MPQQTVTAIQNNFTKGLVTEFTGLNFPENAATDTENCVFTLVGDVSRRLGFNAEANYTTTVSDPAEVAVNTYKWNNAGGDGETQLVVQQTGNSLGFYLASSATVLTPLSRHLVDSLGMTAFAANGNTFDITAECQFSSGNGYLFVYHPSCEPFYCTYTSGQIPHAVVGTVITVQIRDFVGLPEPGVPVNQRPSTLSTEHLYNLTNQGWTAGNAYQGSQLSTYLPVVGDSHTFNAGSSLGAVNGDIVQLTYTGVIQDSAGDVYKSNQVFATGTVTNYSDPNLTIHITTANAFSVAYSGGSWIITPINHGYISTWFSDIGNYPSNADQWWSFKDTTDAFNPSTTVGNTTLNTGYAPKGHYILNAFNQQRSSVSAIAGIQDVSTQARPTNGTWFQGRVWFTGLNSSQPAEGDAGYYTWTENIYFSQIITDQSQFGYCYQINDPTSEDLFDLLPTDGGVIVIQDAGAIYRLFPIQNGMLVFAANGIWFITGSQGIGFTANDYTITKISNVQSISSTSFVNVQGLPYFWNEEGIYTVEPAQRGGLEVNSITVGTILTFYNNIPLQSKKYVRGDYHPIDYIVQWTYRSTNESDVTSRYHFDSILNYNTYNKAFYPYVFGSNGIFIQGINYVSGPGGSTSPDPVFKYLVTDGTNCTFAEENDDTFVDFEFFDNVGVNFTSYFITGYSIKGKAIARFQPTYVTVYSRNDTDTYYGIQSIWDYATDPASGRWSSIQRAVTRLPYFGMSFKRFKLRGQGLVMQIKILSTDGQPFEIMGWSMLDQVNQSA